MIAAAPRGPVTRWLACLIGWAGFTACLIVLTICMLEVTSAGGFCAQGGPYVIATQCPHQVTVLIPFTVPLMLLFVGVSLFAGGFGAKLWALFWSALFCTLGGAFLYSLKFPGYPASAAYTCGILFLIMGGVPLLALLSRPISVFVGDRALDGSTINGPPSAAQFVNGFGTSAIGVAGGWYAALELVAAV